MSHPRARELETLVFVEVRKAESSNTRWTSHGVAKALGISPDTTVSVIKRLRRQGRLVKGTRLVAYTGDVTDVWAGEQAAETGAAA